MDIERLARQFANGLLALIMVSGSAMLVMAQGHDDQTTGMSATHKPTRQENEVVQTVRAATEKFKNVTDVAGPDPDVYALTFGCVSGGDFGAMGMHYLKGSILHDGEIDKNDPEIILFEPTKDGGIRITGVDYIVFVSEWEQNHKGEGPPSIDGQLFHLFDAPNRFGLDSFYTLHVWAWKENPNGTFANWNPNVSCDAFNPPPDPSAH
jgi:hypothetical protein